MNRGISTAEEGRPRRRPGRFDRAPRICESFSLPPGDGVSLDLEQRPVPARPQAAQSGPKHSIEGRQNGSLPFSLQGGELQLQSGVFDGDGLVTAQQGSDESKDRQDKGWHVLRFFVRNPFHANLLRAGAIMANDRIAPDPTTGARSEDAILGRQVFVAQQQLLIDEVRHKGQKAQWNRSCMAEGS
jgi:hypothetical protein